MSPTFVTLLFPLFPATEPKAFSRPKHRCLPNTYKRRKRRKTPKKHQFLKNRRINTFSLRWSADDCRKLMFWWGWAASSEKNQTLGKQIKFQSTQTSWPGNRGRMAPEGRNIWNFEWRTAALGLKPTATHCNTRSPSAAARPAKISIWICTARYRGIWVSQFVGFRKCSIFRGNCDKKQAIYIRIVMSILHKEHIRM